MAALVTHPMDSKLNVFTGTVLYYMGHLLANSIMMVGNDEE